MSTPEDRFGISNLGAGRAMTSHRQHVLCVNLPMLYPDIDKHVETIIKHKVPVVFTSAGNPKTWTAHLQEGIKVAHVVSSVKFALKAQEVERCDSR